MNTPRQAPPADELREHAAGHGDDRIADNRAPVDQRLELLLLVQRTGV
jgi:hypothetical protein